MAGGKGRTSPRAPRACRPISRRRLTPTPRRRQFFETLRGSNRYAILYRINDAKRPETRARRIAQYVRMCAEHRTLH